MTQEDKRQPTHLYKVLDALEAVIRSADPTKRETLAYAISEYARDFSDDFDWATSAQAPVLLHHLLNTIDCACDPEAGSKPRPILRHATRHHGA